MSSSYQLWARPKARGVQHLLRDHLSAVSKNCQAIISNVFSSTLEVSDFGMELEDLLKICSLIGGAHDVGKATPYFQQYVRDQKTDRILKAHSPLSSLYLYLSLPEILDTTQLGGNQNLLGWSGLMCTIAHHGALLSPLDVASKLVGWKDKFPIQINSVDEDACMELNLILDEMQLPPFSDLKQNWKQVLKDIRSGAQVAVKEARKRMNLTFFYLTNLIFSALLDADRMHAAGIVLPPCGNHVNAEMIRSYVEKISKEKELGKRTNPKLLDLRRRLFEALAKKARIVPLDRRIYSLTAPTGSGKTLAGLHFALLLRQRLMELTNSQPRIIYVAPFLSILDQNFELFQNVFQVTEKQSEMLLKHHHLSELSYKVSADPEGESYGTLESELLIEGWNAKIVVTTFVQFLYTILGAGASQLRKLHNLVGSIVILDEVQSIPSEWWRLIKESLKSLAELYKMYFILMTATQPLIFDENEIIELVDNYKDYFEKSNVKLHFKDVYKKNHIDKFTEKVLKILKSVENRSVMILMNTIGSATQVFDVINNSSELSSRPLEYLSAEVLPVDRANRLRSIKDKLDAYEPLVLVTTQVVEAGVDIDFNYVIRDIGPVDSIIQAAGRCNRNGLRPPSKSLVRIFEVSDDRGTFCRRIYGDYAIDKTKKAITDWAPTQSIERLAKCYYEETRIGLSDELSTKVSDGLRSLNYRILDDFKIIKEAPSCSVFIEWNDEAKKVWTKYKDILGSNDERAQKREEFLKLRNKFYSYVINISPRYANGIPRDDTGFLYVSRELVDYCYDERTGFRRTRPTPLI